MLERVLPPRGWLLLAGLPLAIFAVFYVVPVVDLLATSFDRWDPVAGIVPDFQLDFYWDSLTDSFFLEILWRTVRISLVTTLACAIFGYPIAVYVARAGGWRLTGLLIVLLMPLVTGVIVVSYGWLILLGQKGLVTLGLAATGLFEGSPKLMFSETGIVIALAHVLLVFMVMALAAALRAIDANLVPAARSLGAGPWRAFWKIVFPMSLGGLRTGALLVFSLAMSAYAAPALIGGARLKVLSVLIYQQTTSLLNWPLASAMAVILLAVTSGVLGLASAWQQWRLAVSRRAAGAAA